MGVYESIMKLRQRIASPAVAPKEATAGATSQTPSASSAPQAPESPTAPSGQFRAKGVQVLGIPSPEDIPDGISVIEKMQPGSYRSPVPAQFKSRPKMSYTELFEKLGGLEKPETVEQRRQREKKQKRENVMSAISDGISSLANLFFTTRGAPDSFNPSNSMLARTKERWDKINADRQANDRAYYEAYVRARAMDDADEKDQRNWQHTLDREKIADERYEAKAEQDKALAALNEKLRQHQITEAEYKAEQERIKSQYAEQNEKLDLQYKQAGIDQRKAAAGASNAQAKKYNAQAAGTDKPKEFSAWDAQGREHKFVSQEAAHEFARRQGTFHVEEYDVRETTVKPNTSRSGKPITDSKGKPITSTTTKTTTKQNGYPAKPAKGQGYGDNPSKGTGYGN